MEESKVTKMKTPYQELKTSYQEWTEEVLNTSLRVGSIKPRSKVHKYTRAGMWGKTIVCPECVIKLPQYIISHGLHLVVRVATR